MTKRFAAQFNHTRSLTIIVGLFLVLSLLSSCRKETDPGDVTILFWNALSEKNWMKAQYYSVDGSKALFTKNFSSSHIQIGKVNIHYDAASVETYISREYAATNQSFLTYLIRIPKSDYWRVDYPHTFREIKKSRLRSLLEVVKAISTEVKIDLGAWFNGLGRSLLNSIKGFFKKDKKAPPILKSV
jgi:hypothetical protein